LQRNKKTNNSFKRDEKQHAPLNQAFCANRQASMTYEEFNDFCGSLAATSYVVQWGGSHVWKVGGKVFAIGGVGEIR